MRDFQRKDWGTLGGVGGRGVNAGIFCRSIPLAEREGSVLGSFLGSCLLFIEWSRGSSGGGRVGGQVPSFPVTARSLGTQFVNLACLSPSLVPCRGSSVCCKAVPRLVGRRIPDRAPPTTTPPPPRPPRPLSPSFVSSALLSSHRTPLPVGAHLSVLPSPIP